MKVYISLPITGYNYTDRRGKAATVYMNLLGKGFEPVSPMDNGLGEHDSRAEHMKVDFRLRLERAIAFAKKLHCPLVAAARERELKKLEKEYLNQNE